MILSKETIDHIIKNYESDLEYLEHTLGKIEKSSVEDMYETMNVTISEQLMKSSSIVTKVFDSLKEDQINEIKQNIETTSIVLNEIYTYRVENDLMTSD